MLRESLEYCRSHPNLGWRYAEVEGLLGECLTRQGKFMEARPLLEQSYARLRQETQGTDPGAPGRALQRLVFFYGAVGEEASRTRAEADLRAIPNTDS